MTKKSGPAREKRAKGRKLVVDLEDGKREVEVSDLAEGEARAWQSEIEAQMTAFQRTWEKSGDMAALAGALALYSTRLPEWLFKALWHNLELQRRDPNETRFLAVRYAHDFLKMTTDEAYDWAADSVTGPAAGGRDTMMKGYQEIRKQVADIDLIQPRPRTRRR